MEKCVNGIKLCKKNVRRGGWIMEKMEKIGGWIRVLDWKRIWIDWFERRGKNGIIKGCECVERKVKDYGRKCKFNDW